MTFNIPFVIWILIGFFHTIPRELEESANSRWLLAVRRFREDHYSRSPCPRASLRWHLRFSFLSWNEFLFALILTGNEAKTLPVAIAGLMTQQGVQIGAVSAAVMIILLPMILLYFGLRSFLIKGMVAGAVKG